MAEYTRSGIIGEAPAKNMFHEVKQCRICGNSALVPVLNLGEQYLTGVFPRSCSQPLGRGPVELVKCFGDDPQKYCGLVQLRHSFRASEMYGETYGYRSGLNRSMVEHLHNKADYLSRLVRLEDGDTVLDIGSNDGTLLGRYPAEKLRLIGIDPSARKFQRFYRQDITLIVDFFSAEVFLKHFPDGKAKIVTSIAMFYDLDQPQAFVNDVASILAEDGVWHLEQSYLPLMLRTTSYDTVCHEHIEYYSLRQLAWMMERAGLRIIDVQANGINGGSFAVTVAKAGSAIPDNRSHVDELMRWETELGLDTLRPWKEFNLKVVEHRTSILALLDRLKREKKKVFGYGASTKGNVLLQYCGVTPDTLRCIAEVNEDKFGCYTPGTWIPIVPEHEARAESPDYFLVLPWHFRDNILKRETEFLQRGGQLIFPLPEIGIVGG